jgi:hypothetical protein
MELVSYSQPRKNKPSTKKVEASKILVNCHATAQNIKKFGSE